MGATPHGRGSVSKWGLARRDNTRAFSDQNQYEAPKDFSRMNGLVENIRQSYGEVEDARRLEELQRPRELKTHEPGQPLELPGPLNPGANAAGTPGAPPPPAGGPPAGGPPGGPPPLNVSPPPRGVERQER